MVRIDGFFLYEKGHSIHPLTSIESGANLGDLLVTLFVAENALQDLVNKSVFRIKTSRAVGTKLLQIVQSFTGNPDRTEPLNRWEAYRITSAATEFEAVLNAEFSTMDIYLVLKKRGYDTSDLINNGYVLFPEDLPRKVPEAVNDVSYATRCIAFELNTAAGFHFHRANESVLHRYYDAVANGAPRPAGRNIGDYLKVMDEGNLGDPKVKSCLRDLKNLHRNPLIHPEDSIETVYEAVALLGSIHSAVVHMLKSIPEPKAQAVGEEPSRGEDKAAS
jgi:hypothetical protein